MPRQVIAVDVDDVLSASAAGWVAFSNATWGTNLTVEDYQEDWAAMWEIDHEAMVERAHIIHSQTGLISTFDHDAQAATVLRRLAEKYELIIVSSRVNMHRAETLEWLDRHFAGIFSSINLAGIYDVLSKDSSRATKAEIVKRLGADYLVDDQPKHCFAVAENSVSAVLFGDYSWNRSVTLPAGVTRCKDWPAVLEYFNGQR